MAETLGMLCDKLTIVQLKKYHTESAEGRESLAAQARQLQEEIDEYVKNAVSGHIPPERMVFASNKVFKTKGNIVDDPAGDFGEIFYRLAEINCELWHEQEKVYEFEAVPADRKDDVVKKLALLNLARNKCIDALNLRFMQLCTAKTKQL